MMFHINILQVLMSKLLLPSPKSITNCTRRFIVILNAIVDLYWY